MKRVLLISDSRGRDLALDLESSWCDDVTVSVSVHPGAAYEAVLKLIDTTDVTCYDLIIVFLGVHDLTIRHPGSRTLSVRYPDPSSYIERLRRIYSQIRDRYNASCGQPPLVFAPITGVYLKAYCPAAAFSADRQWAVNRTVQEVNRFFRQVNRLSHLYTPETEGPVHRRDRGRYRCRYGRLRDGLLPTHATNLAWVRMLRTAISKILDHITNRRFSSKLTSGFQLPALPDGG